uniref:FBA domain-containing protein n=1 Tax=Parascaris equorum TaxID=6256 RepID=A0A914R5A5_PAREQ
MCTGVSSVAQCSVSGGLLDRLYETNLIDNPSGEKNFDGWTVLDNGGDRMIVEKPPLNCSTNLDDEIPLAFVTSYGWGTMRYVIDLWNEDYLPATLMPLSQKIVDKFEFDSTVSRCIG